MNKKILVVDDEPGNLKLLQQILKEEYILSFAKSGNDAIELANKVSPDLILLDIMMPEMDGYETCRRLKENSATANIPVIFVTAMADVRDEALGFEMGGVDYLTKPVSEPIVLARVKTHLSLVRLAELERTRRTAIHMLGDAGHYNDNDTGVHVWRMASYCEAIARQIGWSEEQCSMLELAASMHDTGKIGIPDAILKKPTPLDEAEWKIMKEHSQVGFDILSRDDSPLFLLAAEIALYHHERWDGSGYPKKLAGEAIPESARIVAIGDVFDTLTNKRVYKESWSYEESIAEIKKSSGSHFEPRLVEAFLAIQPEIRKHKEYWDKEELTAKMNVFTAPED